MKSKCMWNVSPSTDSSSDLVVTRLNRSNFRHLLACVGSHERDHSLCLLALHEVSNHLLVPLIIHFNREWFTCVHVVDDSLSFNDGGAHATWIVIGPFIDINFITSASRFFTRVIERMCVAAGLAHITRFRSICFSLRLCISINISFSLGIDIGITFCFCFSISFRLSICFGFGFWSSSSLSFCLNVSLDRCSHFCISLWFCFSISIRLE